MRTLVVLMVVGFVTLVVVVVVVLVTVMVAIFRLSCRGWLGAIAG